ncbi:MAG: hypothetical protein A2Y57_01975 [Candidatus Woykebacteria bacterium RBG_13_40_7b]|uniref:DUF5615 domain-containing protein n=1 Tax=Candidatus Woykebacteria bacterium RBG_13_40_7b TaxID=1802594 RepID=A0A1G1WBA4_9BACT|nr:MAG: hypothetical protein A2Y57_01975 [Candidatus Woykebacteria bacterium RBG_13_40_7b]
MRFLLDANISPETSQFLLKLDHDARDLISENLYYLTDEEVYDLALKEKRVIITFDLDFGEIYHFSKNKIGLIILRLEDQTVESANKVLEKFLATEDIKKIERDNSLVILTEKLVRFY